MTRIGNTAESQVSGLDEGQAASLLSAVGGHGLSLVESGPATDPAGAGLALHRMYEAWRLTQPQLFWTDENLYGGLDEPGPGAARLVEPAHAAVPPMAGGLDTSYGAAAHPSKEARQPQEGA